MIRGGGIEFLARERAGTVGELFLRPPAENEHPLARFQRPRPRGDAIERLLPARYALDANFVRPVARGVWKIN